MTSASCAFQEHAASSVPSSVCQDIPWHPIPRAVEEAGWNAERKWEDGAVASYGFSPGSEGSGWLFGIGELWAGVRWGLGRDRPWSHQSLPQMEWVQGGTQGIHTARHGQGRKSCGFVQGIWGWERRDSWVFLLALMSWDWAETFSFLFASATHGERQWVDCRWWLLQSKVLGRTEMQEKQTVFPINAEW